MVNGEKRFALLTGNETGNTCKNTTKHKFYHAAGEYPTKTRRVLLKIIQRFAKGILVGEFF